MARLGSEKRPIRVRIQNEKQLEALADLCQEARWKFIAHLDPTQPPDVSQIQHLLGFDSPPPDPIYRPNVSRNDPCPCGSRQKYKKCCDKS